MGQGRWSLYTCPLSDPRPGPVPPPRGQIIDLWPSAFSRVQRILLTPWLSDNVIVGQAPGLPLICFGLYLLVTLIFRPEGGQRVSSWPSFAAPTVAPARDVASHPYQLLYICGSSTVPSFALAGWQDYSCSGLAPLPVSPALWTWLISPAVSALPHTCPNCICPLVLNPAPTLFTSPPRSLPLLETLPQDSHHTSFSLFSPLETWSVPFAVAASSCSWSELMDTLQGWLESLSAPLSCRWSCPLTPCWQCPPRRSWEVWCFGWQQQVYIPRCTHLVFGFLPVRDSGCWHPEPCYHLNKLDLTLIFKKVKSKLENVYLNPKFSCKVID